MYSQSHIIKLSLSYLTNTITISISKSKLLSEVKDRAYKLFFPIRGRIILTYMGKELTPHEGKQISAIFKDLKKARIIIIVSAINTISQNDLLQVNNEEEGENKSNTTSIKQKRLPLLNNRTFPRKKQMINPSRYKSLHSNNKLLCFECCEEPSNFFCRNCNLFLCSYCKNDKNNSHMHHETIEINVDDLKQCANNYKDTLMSDLVNVKENYMKIEKLKQTSYSISNWRYVIEKKINQCCSVLEDLNNFVPKVDMRNISSNIIHTRKFEKEHEQATLILEAIKCSVDTDPFELFSIINNTEKQVTTLFDDVRLLNQYNGVQRKIVNYFMEIETEINKLCLQTTKRHIIN